MKKSNGKHKKIVQMVLRIGFSLIGMIILTGIRQIPVSGETAVNEIQTKSFQNEVKSKDDVVVLNCSVQYPQIKGNDQNKNASAVQTVNRKIETYAIRQFQKRCTEAKEYTNEFMEQIIQGNVPREWLPFTVQITYNTTLNHRDYFSFLYTNFEWLGGAHPNTEQTGFVYDLNQGRETVPEDILLIDRDGVKKYIADEMKKLYEKNPDIYFKEEIEALQKLNFEYGYYLNQEGFVFFFQPYAVAPYVTGIVSVALKYQDHPEWFRVTEPFR